jgi:hypothetical protein
MTVCRFTGSATAPDARRYNAGKDVDITLDHRLEEVFA